MAFSPDFFAIETIGSSWIITACLISYLIGSIPFGLLFTRLAGLGDVRNIGSGNTGATNVLRTGNRKIAALTLLCDVAKGAIPVALFTSPSFDLGTVAGFCAFIGHIFPIWMKFKGGKGVATYLGVLFAVSWLAACLFMFLWIITAIIGRYSSLAALTAALITPIFIAFTVPLFSFFVIALMSIIIFIRHKDNIIRLLHGQESKIKSKK